MSWHVALAVVTISALSGCIDSSSDPPGRCTEYPSLDEMWARWGNDEDGESQSVSFGLSRARASDLPVAPVVWTEYPVSKRPEMLVDYVCATVGRMQDGSVLGDPGHRSHTSEALALAMMRELETERDRQHGPVDDECCWLRIDGVTFGVGYALRH